MSDYEDIRLRDLRLLVRLAELGSITATARELGMPKASASRWLAALEERVGKRLVKRNTRHSALTEAGQTFVEHARNILAEAERAHVAVTSDKPAGRIRVSIPVPMGRMLAGRVAAEFRTRMPAVRLEIQLQNERVELVRDGFDVAVRGGPLPDSGLIASKLGVVPLGLYASPRFADDPLTDVPLVASPGDQALLRQRRGLKLEVALLIDDRLAVTDAVRAGAGAGLLPAFLGEPGVVAGDLIRIDAEPLAAFPVHALFLPSMRGDPRIQAFIDVMRTRLRATISAADT